MTPCEASGGIASVVPCTSAGRWVGPDGKVRCSLHHVQKWGHGEPLVLVDGYEGPVKAKPAAPRRRIRTRSRSG